MRSTTHHRPYTIATDYSTIILTLIFITYCHFVPTYLITTLVPTEDTYTIKTLHRNYILKITPEPFKKYYTILYNDTQLLALVIAISALLCTTLSPYRQTILRPSFRTSLGIYTYFVTLVQFVQAILIAIDNIVAPLFPIILFIALKIFNEPTNTYIREFTMIRNEVYWVPDQLLPPPPLRRLTDPYYYKTQPYTSVTLVPPFTQRSVLLEPNFTHNQHLAEQYRTLRQAYILPYLVPTACPTYAHYCCQIHYTTVADSLADRLYSLTTLTPNFLAPRPLYDFPTPMFTAQFNQTNPPLGPLQFTFYATPLAILNFCTTGPHTDQDPSLWQQYVDQYLRPLSTFVDALTLEHDFLVAAAKATNWAPHFPYMEFLDFQRRQQTNTTNTHTHIEHTRPLRTLHAAPTHNLDSQQSRRHRTRSAPIQSNINPMSPSRAPSPTPPHQPQPRRSERLRQRREQNERNTENNSPQNIDPNLPITQTTSLTPHLSPETPNFPSQENVETPPRPLTLPPLPTITFPLSPRSPSSEHTSNSTNNDYPTSLPTTPLITAQPNIQPSYTPPTLTSTSPRQLAACHQTEQFVSPNDSNNSGYNTVRTHHYSVIHTTTMEPRNSNNGYTHTYNSHPILPQHTPTPLTHNTPTYPSLEPPQRPTFNTTTNHLSAQAPTMQLNSDGAQALTNLLNTLRPNLAPDNKQIDFRHLTQTYTQPRMIQHELKQFANARNVSKTQLDNFVETTSKPFQRILQRPRRHGRSKSITHPSQQSRLSQTHSLVPSIRRPHSIIRSPSHSLLAIHSSYSSRRMYYTRPRQCRPRNSHRPYGTQFQQSHANDQRPFLRQ